MRYFDYEAMARSAGIPPEKLALIVAMFQEELPCDPMLAELHILRACMAIKEGRLTVEEALEEATVPAG